jgi:hypothetical protein
MKGPYTKILNNNFLITMKFTKFLYPADYIFTCNIFLYSEDLKWNFTYENYILIMIKRLESYQFLVLHSL